MRTSADARDPRIAPVVQQLATTAQRVHDVWTRLGVSSVDRQRRWMDFLHQSLLPFLDDFRTLQEAAEYNAATENDVLLREVCYLAVRVEEEPRDRDVATMVTLLREHYAQTPLLQSPLNDATAATAAAPRRSSAFGNVDDDAREGLAVSMTASGRDVAPSHASRKTRELMFLSLPSFTSLLGRTTADDDNDDDRTSTSSAVTRSIGGPVAVADADDEEANLPSKHLSAGAEKRSSAASAEHSDRHSAESAESPTAMAAATVALKRLMRGNTHEGVRQRLELELKRLQRLAEHRLRVLQLLCKQRAILTRSAEEQVALRAAYRLKYLGKEGSGDGGGASELERLSSAHTSLSLSAPPLAVESADAMTMKSSSAASMHAEMTALTADRSAHLAAPVGDSSVSAPCSSHFVSPRTSSKSSTKSSAGCGRAGSHALSTVQQQQQQNTTQTELQLLLSAASCTMEHSVTATADNDHTQEEDEGRRSTHDGPPGAEARTTRRSGSGAVSTWPTCSSTTTDASAAVAAALPPSPRPTVFEADVSSITAYGTHQDLSQRRIQQEAASILRGIDEHNRRMRCEAQEELQALDSLDVLWRAMSTQKNASSDVHAVAADEGDDEERTGQPNGSNGATVPSLQPTPFSASREQVMARYAQLNAAFEADVAAQRSMTSAHSLASASVGHGRDVASTAVTFTNRSPTSSSAASSSASSRRPTAEAEHAVAAAASNASGSLYLSTAVRQVLRAVSYAPVLEYVHRTRLALQQHLSQQQEALVEAAMTHLRSVYAEYYAATGDASYAVAPDGELRVAMEEELLETLQKDTDMAAPQRSQVGSDDDDAQDNEETHSAYYPAAATPVTGHRSARLTTAVLQSFQRHLTACQHVREQAAEEVEYVRLRLHIIQQAAPLVQDMREIKREEAEMHANSRERLLSKKVNMAKQLLQEEKTRRRVTKELPRIVAQLTDLLAAWDALQAASDPRDDTTEAADEASDNAAKGHGGSSEADLWIQGRRVRDLLARSHASAVASVSKGRGGAGAAVTPATRTRARSLPAQPSRFASARSASPAPPAQARRRVEATAGAAASSPNSTQAVLSQTAPHSRSPALTGRPASQPAPRHRSPPPPLSSSASSTAPRPAARSVSAPRRGAPLGAQRTPTPGQRSVSPLPSPQPHHPLRVRSQSPASRQQQQQQQQRRGLSSLPVNGSAAVREKASRSPAPTPSSGVHHAAPFSLHFHAPPRH